MAPTKLERDACNAAKANFHASLDKNQLWLPGLSPHHQALTHLQITEIDPNNPEFTANARDSTMYPADSLNLLKLYKTACLASWVKQFDTTRLIMLQRDYLKTREKEERERKRDPAYWQEKRRKPE